MKTAIFYYLDKRYTIMSSSIRMWPRCKHIFNTFIDMFYTSLTLASCRLSYTIFKPFLNELSPVTIELTNSLPLSSCEILLVPNIMNKSGIDISGNFWCMFWRSCTNLFKRSWYIGIHLRYYSGWICIPTLPAWVLEFFSPNIYVFIAGIFSELLIFGTTTSPTYVQYDPFCYDIMFFDTFFMFPSSFDFAK